MQIHYSDVFGYKYKKKIEALEKLASKVELSTVVSLPDSSSIQIREKELHVTVDSLKPNSVGLKLGLRGNTLFIANDMNANIYYEEDYLKKSFENKWKHKLVYVMAENRRVQGQLEEFWYNEAYLLDGFDFGSFSSLVNKGVIMVDIRIGHYPDGRLHDHGTAFRVFRKNLPECFKHIKPLL